MCNAAYGQMRIQKVVPCSLHSYVENELGECNARVFFYYSVELTVGISEMKCCVGKSDFVKIVADVVYYFIGRNTLLLNCVTCLVIVLMSGEFCQIQKKTRGGVFESEIFV